ncbi:alcohol dehydrogenase (plasmid) [Fulvitalea axinellae]|uniref:Alcohol dehydrogenase n=2 Tax=Fulvitalea axinellae TaxID=1182444 RepID=A0AAU9CTY2_9BACT|nr:alcohol dehydrogenase [Fulvitalea axinellae]
MMKAVVYDRYGAPDVLRLAQKLRPTARKGEVLIRVRATSVTAGDWRLRRADPCLVRLYNGISKPRRRILGHEFAGEVVGLGEGAEGFAIGDRVFGSTGFGSGAHAEYLCQPADGPLAHMPDGLGFEEAATAPVGALTALHFLREGDVGEGDRLLIHGASGSVGSAAVQLAKAYGAMVTAVCGPSNTEAIKALGADRVVDYSRTDFTKTGERYDFAFNTVGETDYSECKKVLKSGGTYLACDATLGDYGKLLLKSVFGGRRIVAGVARETKEDLLRIRELLAKGMFCPLIGQRYSLAELPEAHAHAESGHKRGNLSVKVA